MIYLLYSGQNGHSETEILLRRQWHWFVCMSAGIESNKAPHRGEKIKIKKSTLRNSPWTPHSITSWSDPVSSFQIVWRESKPEVKQSGPLSELAAATATHSLSVHTVCVHCGTGCSYWGAFVSGYWRYMWQQQTGGMTETVCPLPEHTHNACFLLMFLGTTIISILKSLWNVDH